MIQYLKIKNFGPIKDTIELSFEVAEDIEPDSYEVTMPDGRKLLKLAYIYGANASGKTTVLKAFDFLRKLLLRPVSDKAAALDYDPFLFQESPYAGYSAFELAFYMDGIRYIYELNFNRQFILYEKLVFYRSAKATELFSRTTDIEKRLSSISFGANAKVPSKERDLLEGNTLYNNTVLGAYARTNVDIRVLEQLNKWLDQFLMGLVTASTNLTERTASFIAGLPHANDWINAFLNKADTQLTGVHVEDKKDVFDVSLEDFRFPSLKNFSKGFDLYSLIDLDDAMQDSPGSYMIDFIHQVAGDKSYSLGIGKESRGTRRYFGLGGMLYLLTHGASLLCIDELETSLHPDLMKHFLQTFLMNATASQLLITTHNLSLMGEADFIRRDAAWFTEKDSDGAVQLYSAADFDSQTLRKDASLINAYKSGRLGAKPNLGSPYFKTE